MQFTTKKKGIKTYDCIESREMYRGKKKGGGEFSESRGSLVAEESFEKIRNKIKTKQKNKKRKKKECNRDRP